MAPTPCGTDCNIIARQPRGGADGVGERNGVGRVALQAPEKGAQRVRGVRHHPAPPHHQYVALWLS